MTVVYIYIYIPYILADFHTYSASRKTKMRSKVFATQCSPTACVYGFLCKAGSDCDAHKRLITANEIQNEGQNSYIYIELSLQCVQCLFDHDQLMSF